MSRSTLLLLCSMGCSSAPPPVDTCSRDTPAMKSLQLVSPVDTGAMQIDLAFEGNVFPEVLLGDSYYAAATPSGDAFGANDLESVSLVSSGVWRLRPKGEVNYISNRYRISLPDRRIAGCTSTGYGNGGPNEYVVTVFLAREQQDAGFMFSWQQLVQQGHP